MTEPIERILAALGGIGALGHVMVAVVAGGVIGLERTFHGRPAGFRTHTLVCISSTLLMLVASFHGEAYSSSMGAMARIDPTRMAQGVMTGIGFLGAGVIMREGLSVRGLTTAASIWTTAAIGILAGSGLYGVVLVATILTLGTLTVFRRIETIIPTQHFAHHVVRFARETVMPEHELRELIAQHGFSTANLSYRLTGEGKFFEYRMIIRTLHVRNAERLAQALTALPSVREFRIDRFAA